MKPEKYLYTSINTSDYKIWMAFPAIYSFSMSSLGFLWMFKTLDEVEDVNIERICSDTETTQFNPKDIELIAFSFSFDLDFLEIFKMLEKYNIPLKANERNKPLIFAGGPVVSANPELYKEIFDFFVIGDGEDINLEAVRICKANKDKSKDEILKLLSEIEGVYVPKYPKTVHKHTKKISECIYTPILTEEAFFPNTFVIEMTRGCANRCGFCLASYLNLPLRSIPYETLKNIIDLSCFVGIVVVDSSLNVALSKLLVSIFSAVESSPKIIGRLYLPFPLKINSFSTSSSVIVCVVVLLTSLLNKSLSTAQ